MASVVVVIADDPTVDGEVMVELGALFILKNKKIIIIKKNKNNKKKDKIN
jgi:hypothetical protein